MIQHTKAGVNCHYWLLTPWEEEEAWRYLYASQKTFLRKVCRSWKQRVISLSIPVTESDTISPIKDKQTKPKQNQNKEDTHKKAHENKHLSF